MSLVGPRPHAIAHNEMYRKLISGYMIRHKVRPGITGLAQVNGLRGETETIDKMRERVRYDLEYLRHWSPWLDIKILCAHAGADDSRQQERLLKEAPGSSMRLLYARLPDVYPCGRSRPYCPRPHRLEAQDIALSRR